MSAASGFGFFDDARAVATVDWDFDGDLDFWITNRTAPRIRLLRNNQNGGNHFVAFRLVGDGKTTNIDGIGARVEVTIKSNADGAKRKLIRTLYAGNGYLAQSSKWLHFGLGDADKIESLIIRWPGGAAQEIKNVAVDNHYHVSQKAGKLKAFNPALEKRNLQAKAVDIEESTDAARIVLPSRLPLPALTYSKWHGQAATVASRGGSPMLVNVWASWCLPCWQEFADWTKHADQIKASGLKIVALNVDGIGRATKSPDPRERLKKMGFPFTTGKANRELLDILDAFQRATLDRWLSMPVPTSVLVDRFGRVAVIYRGPVDAKQLLEDMELLRASSSVLRQAAIPFQGRWDSDVPIASPGQVVSQLIDMSMINHAVDYLIAYIDDFAGLELSPGDRKRVGDACFTAAVLLKDQGKVKRSAEVLQKGVAANPNDLRMRMMLGELKSASGDLDEAAKHLSLIVKAMPSDLAAKRKLALIQIGRKQYASAIALLEQVTRAQPTNALAHVDMASAWLRMGNHRNACTSYRLALSAYPKLPKALNNLAWILSTHGDASLRNGSEAIKLAQRLCAISQYKSPSALDTLAAAYAEAGQFELAVQTAGKAIALFPKNTQAAAAKEIALRLKLYKQNKPFRDR